MLGHPLPYLGPPWRPWRFQFFPPALVFCKAEQPKLPRHPMVAPHPGPRAPSPSLQARPVRPVAEISGRVPRNTGSDLAARPADGAVTKGAGRRRWDCVPRRHYLDSSRHIDRHSTCAKSSDRIAGARVTMRLEGHQPAGVAATEHRRARAASWAGRLRGDDDRNRRPADGCRTWWRVRRTLGKRRRDALEIRQPPAGSPRHSHRVHAPRNTASAFSTLCRPGNVPAPRQAGRRRGFRYVHVEAGGERRPECTCESTQHRQAGRYRN